MFDAYGFFVLRAGILTSMQLCFRILTLSVNFATIDSATVMKGLDRRVDEDLKDDWTNG